MNIVADLGVVDLFGEEAAAREQRGVHVQIARARDLSRQRP